MTSSHVSADDWRQAAELLGATAQVASFAEFSVQTARGLRKLFQADLAVWTHHDGQARPLGFLLDPDLTSQLGRLWAPFQAHFHEHPMAQLPVFRHQVADEKPFVLSDYYPMRSLTRLPLFNEVYVHLFAKHQLALAGRIHRDLIWTCASNRLRREYGPRDRALARFLKPRLTGIARALVRRERAVSLAGALGEFFGNTRSAWALIAADGKISELSAAATALLAEAPGGSPSPGRLPASCASVTKVVADFCGRTPSTLSRPVFAVVKVTATLEAVVLDILGPGRALVLFQRTTGVAVSPLLTRREAEILAWLGEGKSNAEIGRVLGVSPRTVEKHCGNLFAKIGVESRLAAALLARQRAGR